MPPQVKETDVIPPPDRKLPQHGVKGVYYGGDWVDIEDCVGTFSPTNPTSGDQFKSKCDSCPNKNSGKCARSRSRLSSALSTAKDSKTGITTTQYDVVIIGAGCIGSAIARELSKYSLSTLLLEAADDVSQGATKGNSGIVHAGYDDKPNTNRAKYCWKGNQMFADLDKELRFGYQKNGSLVLATSDAELAVLDQLKSRGDTNGVKNLEILNKDQLRAMEPAVNENAVGALYSPDAGNVIPYEYAIAMAENAVDNGVELRIRREVINIDKDNSGEFVLNVRHWEPKHYIESTKKYGDGDDSSNQMSFTQKVVEGFIIISTIVPILFVIYTILGDKLDEDMRRKATAATGVLFVSVLFPFSSNNYPGQKNAKMPLDKLAEQISKPVGNGGQKVSVEDMFTGGSGSWNAVNGQTVEEEIVRAKYIINCAGGASDKIAKMIGDDSFNIKPRLGDYLLLNRNQGYLTSKTIFPCPDPVLGKGVLVQTTLWGNLILGPTARDTYKPEARDMTDNSVQEYILSKCRKLIPHFDPKETFHAFCGARSKSDRGDWIIERSAKDGNFIHAAGIDSPGLAGSPAIALEIVRLLDEAGLSLRPNPTFNPNRAPIIIPKQGMKGLKMGPLGKNDSGGTDSAEDEKKMASNVICKCEKVTELEVVTALRRSLPIDSSQAIRKRTRAGMGHCQGGEENYNCECRVKAIIARENRSAVEEVGGRPWPATSTLTQRWIDEKEKNDLQERMMKN